MGSRGDWGEKANKDLKFVKGENIDVCMLFFVAPINVDHVILLKELFSPFSCARITHWCGMVTQ